MISESSHYRTAESILGEIGTVPRSRPELAIAMAQVYATLAVADAVYATMPDPSTRDPSTRDRSTRPVPDQQPAALDLSEPYFTAGRAVSRRRD